MYLLALFFCVKKAFVLSISFDQALPEVSKLIRKTMQKTVFILLYDYINNRRDKIIKNKVKCSVCGNLIDDIPYEICPVCDWERDLIQEEFPDEEGWANDMSLNQARKDWAKKQK